MVSLLHFSRTKKTLLALVAWLSIFSVADAFSVNVVRKLVAGSPPQLAPRLSKTSRIAGHDVPGRKSATSVNLFLGDPTPVIASLANADTTNLDSIMDQLNFLAQYNTLVGFSLFFMALRIFANAPGAQSRREAQDSAVLPKVLARFEPPSPVTADPTDRAYTGFLPRLFHPEDEKTVRPLEQGIPEKLQAKPRSRFGFRRHISSTWNRFRNGGFGFKRASVRENQENINPQLNSLKARLQKADGKESKQKLAPISMGSSASSAAASSVKPGSFLLPLESNVGFLGRMHCKLETLWDKAKTVGKALKPQKAYLANMVLLTGLTGGIMSSTMMASSAIGNPNGRLSVHGHTVVLADKLDDKVLTVLSGMAHEAASSNDAAGRLKRGVVVLTPQDRIAVHQQIASRLAEERGTGREGKKGEGRRAERLDFITRQGDPTVMEDLNKVCVKDASRVVWVKEGASSHDSVSSSRPSHLTGTGPEGAVTFASQPLTGAWKKTTREAALLRELRGSQDAEHDLEELHVGPHRSPSAPVLVFSNEAERSRGLRRVGGREFVHVMEMATSEAVLRKTALQPTAGMATALNELLGGDVVPLHSESVSQACPWLMGRPLSEAQASFPSVVICGIIRGDDVFLSPPPTTWISPFDRLVAIGSSQQGMPKPVQPRSPPPLPKVRAEEAGRAKVQEQPAQGVGGDVLVLNWNAMGQSVLEEMRSVTPEGRVVKVMADYERAEQFGTMAGGLKAGPERAGVELYRGHTDDPEHLQAVGVRQSKVIVVLPDGDQAGHVDGSSDASLLATVQGLADSFDVY